VEVVLPLEVQRVKADDKIEVDRGRVALRYGPLIYSVERADQPDLNQALSRSPLVAGWRGDLLQGVVAIKGTWADASPMLAIPYFARQNRLSETARAARPETAGDPTINYAGGASVNPTGSGATPTTAPATNAPTTGSRAQSGRASRDGGNSMVWIKDE
jgi:hypothetical protein